MSCSVHKCCRLWRQGKAVTESDPKHSTPTCHPGLSLTGSLRELGYGCVAHEPKSSSAKHAEIILFKIILKPTEFLQEVAFIPKKLPLSMTIPPQILRVLGGQGEPHDPVAATEHLKLQKNSFFILSYKQVPLQNAQLTKTFHLHFHIAGGTLKSCHHWRIKGLESTWSSAPPPYSPPLPPRFSPLPLTPHSTLVLTQPSQANSTY